jgi:hypothetical protein
MGKDPRNAVANTLPANNPRLAVSFVVRLYRGPVKKSVAILRMLDCVFAGLRKQRLFKLGKKPLSAFWVWPVPKILGWGQGCHNREERNPNRDGQKGRAE